MNYQNYINLRYYNYLKYEGQPEDVFNNTRSRILKQFKNSAISQQDINTIEEQLNYFYSATEGNFTQNSVLTEDVFKLLMEAIYEYVEKNSGRSNVVISNTLRGGSSQYNFGRDIVHQIEKLDNTVQPYLTTIDKKMQKLEEFRYSLIKNKGDQNLLQKINSILVLWEQIKLEVQSNNEVQVKGSKYGNFFKEYNNLVNAIFTSNKQITGLVGEAATAAIMYLMTLGTEKIKQLTKDEILSILNETIVGDKVSIKGFEADNVLSHMFNKKELASMFSDRDISSIKHRGSLVSVVMNKDSMGTGGTQDKVDVIFSFNNQPIKATVKNYDLSNAWGKKYGIHLVSGTNPFILLSQEAKFLQHYFNVTSEHGYTNSIMHSNTTEQLEPSSRTVFDAHKLAKQIMFANALVGGQFQYNTNTKQYSYGDKAEVFIINDTSIGKYRVYAVQDLINKIMENFHLINDVSGYPKDDRFRFDISGWENMSVNGKERMKKIYMQMNAMKIGISLDFAAITGGGFYS